MSQVERFFHIRRGNSTNGGATVRVVGNTERVGQVDVQVAYCHPLRFKENGKVTNPEDMFQKDVGRLTAIKKPIKVVALRYLPAELGRIAAEVDKRAGSASFAFAAMNDYTFAIKYFLPKE